MDNETLFYTCGIALAVSAVVFTFLALKVEKFPGRATPIVFVWFAVLVGGSTTYAVLHSQDEEHHREEAAGLPHATEEAEEIEEEAAEAAPEH